jgi:flagellar basal-body rod modification protein FlgD
MATTDGVGGTNATDPTAGLTPTRTANSTLGKDDFLKLLVGQMKNMDPLGASNSDPSQSMAQMTQYSILEQLTNLSESTKESSTMAMIGRTVTYAKADGTTAEGAVESVQTVGGKLTLTIDGTANIDPDTVIEVR